MNNNRNKDKKNKLAKFLNEPVIANATKDKDQHYYKDNIKYFRTLSLCPNCNRLFDILDIDKEHYTITLSCERCFYRETHATDEVKKRVEFMKKFVIKYFGEEGDPDTRGLILTDETER